MNTLRRWLPRRARVVLVACALLVLLGTALSVLRGDFELRRATERSQRPAERVSTCASLAVDGQRSLASSRASTDASEVAAFDDDHGEFGLRLRGGAPLPGCEITVVVARSTARGPVLVTDARGRCVVTDFARVEALEARGEGVFPRRFARHELEAPRDEAGVRWLEVDARGSLAVQVVEASGAPVARARIAIFPAAEGTGRRVDTRPALWPLFLESDAVADGALPELGQPGRTGADGTLFVLSLPVGTRLLVLATLDAREAQGVFEIPDAGGTATAKLVLPEGARLGGRIVDPRGAPVANVLVGWCPPRTLDTGAYAVRSGPDGRFELAGLGVGVQRWIVDRAGEQLRSTRVEAPRTDVGDVVVADSVRVAGRVVSATRAPDEILPSYRVVASRDGLEIAAATSARDGAFELDVPPGETDLELRTLDDLVSATHVVAPAADVLFDLDRATSSLVFELAGDGACREIAVELARAGGSARAGAWTLGGDPSRLRALGGSRYALDFLPCGDFDVEIACHGAGAWRRDGIELEPGVTVDLGVAITGFGSVRGSLRDASGAPHANTEVIALPEALASGQKPRRHAARTAPDGSFVFEQLAAGMWSIFPATLGSTGAERLRVEPAATAAVELTAAAERALDVAIVRGAAALATAGVVVQLSAGDGFDGGGIDVRRSVDERGLASFEGLCAPRYKARIEWRDDAGVPRLEQHVVELSAEPRTRVEFEIGGASTIVTFADGGGAFAIGVNSRAIERGGWSYLRGFDAGASRARVSLGPGPWLFALRPASAAFAADAQLYRARPVLPAGFALAVVGASGAEPPSELDVELPATTIEIESREGALGDLELRVVSIVHDGAEVWLPAPISPLTERTSARVVTCRSVPLGATVVIRGRDALDRETETQVDVRTAHTKVTWPPELLAR